MFKKQVKQDLFVYFVDWLFLCSSISVMRSVDEKCYEKREKYDIKKGGKEMKSHVDDKCSDSYTLKDKKGEPSVKISRHSQCLNEWTTAFFS